MFQWTIIFAVIAVASGFLGMSDAAQLSNEIASATLFTGLIFVLMSMFGPERKFRSHA